MKRIFDTKLYKLFADNSLYIAFTIALLASLISLSLSEVFKLVPCVLCWYQRSMMYAMPFILGVAIWRKDKKVDAYIWPLATIGWVIALYHSLLQWKLIPEYAAPCQAGISCTTVQINYLGFITIPFMAFVSFSGILICMYAYRRKNGTRD